MIFLSAAARPTGRKSRRGRRSALSPAAARDHGSFRLSKVLKLQELGEKRQLAVDEAKKLPQKLWEEVKQDLDQRAAQGETVVEGGTGGKSLDAQIHLAEGRGKGGQARAKELDSKSHQEMGKEAGLSNPSI
eukprot:SM000032S12171  [mRNA]  locus=s32:948299:949261:- [translate_table: standard]